MYRGNWLPEIFNDFVNNYGLSKTNNTAPAINVLESAEDYKVELAAPGLRKEDFDVRLDEDGDLMIRLDNKREAEEQKAHYLRREFSYSKFEQTLILPDDVDKDRIEARVADGVLTITLPKIGKEQVKASRQINVD